MFGIPDVMVVLLALVIFIQVVPGSNLGLATSYFEIYYGFFSLTS
jgi:hypothetical protein